MAYTFDFIGNDGSIDHFQLGLFADDLEALKQAQAALLASSTAIAVDVWRGDDRVGWLDRRAARRARN